MFAMLVTGMYNETSWYIELNYLNAKIFYNDINYNSVKKLIMDDCKVNDIDIVNNMWFDQTYGFSNVVTFNVYMRIAYLYKTNIRAHLVEYFGITDKQMGCIANDTENLIGANIVKYSTELNNKFYDSFCKASGGDHCTGTDYAIIQWATNGLTNDIDKVFFL